MDIIGRSKSEIGKRASIADFLFISVLTVVLFMIFIVFAIVFMNVSAGFREATEGTEFEEEADNFADQLDKWHPVTDVAIVLFLFAMLIGTVIGGYLIGGHPIFLLIYFVQCIIITVVTLAIGDVLTQVIQQLAGYLFIYGYPITSWVLSKFVYWIIGFEVLLGIALYMKPKDVEGFE